MANKNKVVGQLRIKADGQLLESDGQATMDIGGAQRESVLGDYQAGAFRESTQPAKVETSVLVKAGTSLTALRAIDNATLTLETDTGQTFIVRGAYASDVISFSQSDGKAKVVFMGPPAEEMV